MLDLDSLIVFPNKTTYLPNCSITGYLQVSNLGFVLLYYTVRKCSIIVLNIC